MRKEIIFCVLGSVFGMTLVADTAPFSPVWVGAGIHDKVWQLLYENDFQACRGKTKVSYSPYSRLDTCEPLKVFVNFMYLNPEEAKVYAGGVLIDLSWRKDPSSIFEKGL